MNTYRIQRSTSVDTVETISDYVIRKLDPDGIYRCIGTGSKEECFAIAERCNSNRSADAWKPINGGWEVEFAIR